MKKNTREYSVLEVMRGVCNRRKVWKNWPFNKFKRLTVTDMLKIGVENRLWWMDVGYILCEFDREMYDELDERGNTIEEMVLEYIELKD